MQPRCMVMGPGGKRCGRPATVFDQTRGDLVCLRHAATEPLPALVEEIRLLVRSGLYRRAMALLRELDQRYREDRERLLQEEGLPQRPS